MFIPQRRHPWVRALLRLAVAALALVLAGCTLLPSPAPPSAQAPAPAASPRPSAAPRPTAQPKPTAAPTARPSLASTTRPQPATQPPVKPEPTAQPTPAAAPAPRIKGFEAVTPGQLPAQARDTLARIARGGPFPYRQDGAVFQNRERILPRQPAGYYHEYTVETPGSDDRGARRIITGAQGEIFYTDDHYASFVQVLPQ
jgi:ribonuclease T1